ncbi:glycogen synthase GlgA [Christensenellaceae bacterium OttesenSCG-928-K19]|nr:glycogen synthase GlgA [Christensenellaceae bacterium OttesenSCG-928-K19]
MSMPKVLIAAAESAPFVSTGGLAEVMGALPKALLELGMDVAVIMPKHSAVKQKYQDKLTNILSLNISMGWRNQYMGIETMQMDGVTYYFIDNEYYFGGPVYKGGDAETEQYMYFCRAVLEALPFIEFKPDIIHANDWHTAMIPMLLKTQYQEREQGGIKTVLTIHNLQYQGQTDFAKVADFLGISDGYFSTEYLEAYGSANIMKAGLVFADKITTVSPTYAKEVVHPFYGRGMEGILQARKNDLSGILNGIDYGEYSPAKDSKIACNYDVSDIAGKYKNKTALIKEMHMDIDENVPVICMITRMTEQKGIDLVRVVLEEVLHENAAFVVLGSGDHQYEEYFNYIAARYPKNTGIYIGYDDTLAHKIYAGSDFLLMPSLFEPCGMSQMIAQSYGTLPIVRETGGLVDTVQPYNIYTQEGNGFSFNNYNAHDMLNVIWFALNAYKDKGAMLRLIKNAMKTDNSFLKSAKEYKALYESLAG